MVKKRVTVTFTEEEYNFIKEDAERNYRSFNDELRYKLKLIKPGEDTTPTRPEPGVNYEPGLHYPPGVRSSDYNAYYETIPQKRSVIG